MYFCTIHAKIFIVEKSTTDFKEKEIIVYWRYKR